ncbi:hypothetical protein ABKN59_002257 [Abortiporus biennis]
MSSTLNDPRFIDKHRQLRGKHFPAPPEASVCQVCLFQSNPYGHRRSADDVSCIRSTFLKPSHKPLTPGCIHATFHLHLACSYNPPIFRLTGYKVQDFRDPSFSECPANLNTSYGVHSHQLFVYAPSYLSSDPVSVLFYSSVHVLARGVSVYHSGDFHVPTLSPLQSQVRKFSSVLTGTGQYRSLRYRHQVALATNVVHTPHFLKAGRLGYIQIKQEGFTCLSGIYPPPWAVVPSCLHGCSPRNHELLPASLSVALLIIYCYRTETVVWVPGIWTDSPFCCLTFTNTQIPIHPYSSPIIERNTMSNLSTPTPSISISTSSPPRKRPRTSPNPSPVNQTSVCVFPPLEQGRERQETVKWKRDKKFYFADGDCIIRVNQTLFKVHRFILARDGSAFQDMFALPEGNMNVGMTTMREGCGDENPIVVYGDKESEWRVLLSILYALPAELSMYTSPPTPQTTFKTLPALLTLASITNKYHFNSTESWVADTLFALHSPSSSPTTTTSTSPISPTSPTSSTTTTLPSAFDLRTCPSTHLERLLEIGVLCSHEGMKTLIGDVWMKRLWVTARKPSSSPSAPNSNSFLEMMELGIEGIKRAILVGDKYGMKTLCGVAYYVLLICWDGSDLGVGGGGGGGLEEEGGLSQGQEDEDEVLHSEHSDEEGEREDDEDDNEEQQHQPQPHSPPLKLTPTQQLKLLKGHFNLIQLWDNSLSMNAPKFERPEGCTYHSHGCLSSWNSVWESVAMGGNGGGSNRSTISNTHAGLAAMMNLAHHQHQQHQHQHAFQGGFAQPPLLHPHHHVVAPPPLQNPLNPPPPPGAINPPAPINTNTNPTNPRRKSCDVIGKLKSMEEQLIVNTDLQCALTPQCRRRALVSVKKLIGDVENGLSEVFELV